ncbi:hypothetical protein [Nocardia sp. NPDC050710]|uniref:hypothetical protein n=1 Tax=Nocardia sp. NPDC050710 TaxID=3157220 RepID=UPI0033D75C1A
MTDPVSPRELIGWKSRLLDRIRDLALEQWRITRDNDLDPLWPQKRDPALDHLRAHRDDLKREEHELIVRARASGVRGTDVDVAANVFVRGHQRAPVPEGEEAVRAQLIDAIAADIWTLEHMAAIACERRWRYRNDSLAPDTQEQHRHERNMAVIWGRAAATASVAGLSDREQAELWGRDQLGWTNLFEETTYFYDDRELEARWRAYADPGAANDVTNATDAVAIDLERSAYPATRPPSPQALMDRAADALNAEIRALGSEDDYHEYRIDYFLGAIIPAAERDDQAREVVADTSEPDRQLAAAGASELIEACRLDNNLPSDAKLDLSAVPSGSDVAVPESPVVEP